MLPFAHYYRYALPYIRLARPSLTAMTFGLVAMTSSAATPLPTPKTIDTPTRQADQNAPATNPRLAAILAAARDKKLAEQVTWRRLLYYPEFKRPVLDFYKSKDDKNNTSRMINRFNSEANQQRFFIHPKGGTNAQAELDAMLTAMFDPTLTGDDAAQCRFPARSAWLKQQLNIPDSELPMANCPSFDAWRKKIHPQSASIIFANEYLDSLPSAFGHSFLRFDNDNEPYYLNYTPKVTEGESQLKFSYKSTIAGNAGEFSINNYAQGIKDYKQTQGRDVWQYRLNLSDEQVAQLARQVYEVKDQILPYYLLDDNCASEILVLLNGLFPEKNYLKGMKVSVAPAQIVRRLADEGLITESNFEPSSVTEQQSTINTQRLAQDKPNLTDSKIGLVASRNDPLLSNPLGQVSIGYAYQDADSAHSALRLGYRMVYHDALDKPAGYPLGSQLSALSVAANLSPNHKNGHDSVELDHATLLQIRSFNPINTAKAKLHNSAWGLNVGLQQAFDGHRDDGHSHLVAHTSVEYGKSFAYGQPLAGSGEIPPNLCYALGNLATEFGKGLSKGYRLGVGANLGCIQQFSHNWRGLAELSLPYWLGGDSGADRYWQPKLTVGTQYDINRTNALRVSASRRWLDGDNIKRVDDLTVSFLHYFE